MPLSQSIRVDRDIEDSLVCPDCNGKHLIKDYKRGELICDRCGLVITDKIIDPGPEWRAFDMDEEGKKARTGDP